jgi:predicted nucleic acid-binding protein
MTFADLPAGAAVFLDANILVYYLSSHSVFGPACRQLVNRIETGEIVGHTSTAVLSELAHRLMTLEAMMRFGWTSKIVDRLKKSPASVQQLSRFRQALLVSLGCRSAS